MMDNDKILLEALAESQEALKKEVGQVKSQLNDRSADDSARKEIEKLLKICRLLTKRIEKVESERSNNIRSAEMEKPRWLNIKFNKRAAGAAMVFALITWYSGVLINRGFEYQEPYYKYQSMDLFGMDKDLVEYLFEIRKDSMKQMVDDSLSVWKDRREALLEIEEHRKRINSLKEEFGVGSEK